MKNENDNRDNVRRFSKKRKIENFPETLLCISGEIVDVSKIYVVLERYPKQLHLELPASEGTRSIDLDEEASEEVIEFLTMLPGLCFTRAGMYLINLKEIVGFEMIRDTIAAHNPTLNIFFRTSDYRIDGERLFPEDHDAEANIKVPRLIDRFPDWWETFPGI